MSVSMKLCLKFIAFHFKHMINIIMINIIIHFNIKYVLIIKQKPTSRYEASTGII